MKSLCLQEIEMMENKIDNCKNMNIKEINIEDIDDIDNINVDENKSSEDRINDFLKEVTNPYFFNINGYVVKFSYQENKIKAEECIHNAIKNLINK